ncbi:MAG: hypothetical protein ACLTML_16955 [Blautia faecis]
MQKKPGIKSGKQGTGGKEFKHMEKQRNQLQSIINNIDKELKNSGQIKLVLPEAGHWNWHPHIATKRLNLCSLR